MPAVFVYSPSYIYVTRAHLPEISLGNIDTPEDRFNGLSSWYLATDRVWKIFAKK
jgi:peptide/nickel transport system substrate-binding protein